MKIDDLAASRLLTQKLQETIPFKVFPSEFLLKFLRDRGDSPKADIDFTVEMVGYSGDAGGIMCTLALSPHFAGGNEILAVSISNLKIDPEHPLASEVIEYQRSRIHKLKLQEQGGFRANLLSQSPPVKRKRKAGFGK
jgi:hypothetical protein